MLRGKFLHALGLLRGPLHLEEFGVHRRTSRDQARKCFHSDSQTLRDQLLLGDAFRLSEPASLRYGRARDGAGFGSPAWELELLDCLGTLLWPLRAGRFPQAPHRERLRAFEM